MSQKPPTVTFLSNLSSSQFTLLPLFLPFISHPTPTAVYCRKAHYHLLSNDPPSRASPNPIHSTHPFPYPSKPGFC